MNAITRVFSALVLIICLAMCSEPPGSGLEENRSQNATGYFDTTLVDPMDTVIEFSDPQVALDDFLLRFATIKSLPALRYQNAYEYESQHLDYFYEGNRLAGVFQDHGIEGGGGGHLYIAIDQLKDGSLAETVLYVPYYSGHGKGYFCYPGNNQLSYYEVSGDEDFYHPQIVGPGEEQLYEYETTLAEYRQIIIDNKSGFTKNEGKYTWDIRRGKADSDYGEVEIFETILVDSIIFVTQF